MVRPEGQNPKAKPRLLAFGFWIETSIETCTGIRVPGSLSGASSRLQGFSARSAAAARRRGRRRRRRRRSAVRSQGGGGGGRRRRQARRNVEEDRGS